MTSHLRVGLVGAGWVGTARHLPSLARLGRVELVAVCDRHPDRARSAAERFDVGHAVDDLDELLALGLDAVSIATSPWSHPETAIRSLEAGCHVFCEKPMAVTTADARAMAAAAETVGRLLCISHNFLFSRTVRRADRELEGHQIRYVSGLQLSSRERRLPDWAEQLPGGLLGDESPHLFYLLAHFLGGPLDLASVRGHTRDGARWPTSVEVLVEGPHGPGQVTMVMDAPVSEWHGIVVADDRVVGLDLFRDIPTVIHDDGTHGPIDIARTSAKAMLDQTRGFAASGARLVTRRQFWGHDRLIAAFVEACLDDLPSPVPVGDSVGVVALTEEVLAGLGITPTASR